MYMLFSQRRQNNFITRKSDDGGNITASCKVPDLRGEVEGVGLRCGRALYAFDVLIACADKESEMGVLCQASTHQQWVGEQGVQGGEETLQVKV